MSLKEDIKRIKKLIVELSPKSHGVAEFLNHVENRPQLIDHLRFSSLQDLKDYVADANIGEFYELRMEVEEYEKKLSEYLNSEINEFERVSQFLNNEEGIDISVSDLIEIFESAIEVTLSQDILNKLENSECGQINKGELKKVSQLAKDYDKSDPKELKKILMKGDYNRPLILKFGDRYHLIAGNTRLCTAMAIGLKPKVLIGDLNNNVNEIYN